MMRKKLVSVLTISVICVSMLLGCSVSTDTALFQWLEICVHQP